jgi:hypothetical protein
MKKIMFFILPFLLLLAFSQNTHAGSYIKYEIVEIQSEGIVVKDNQGKLSLIKNDPADLKVGDIVTYDSIRERMRKSPWQLATITEMNNSTITLQPKNGESLKTINMRAHYRGEFSPGEEVLYKESAKQIKKSNFQDLGE